MKDLHRYVVQVSDTTMLHRAAYLFGQKILALTKLLKHLAPAFVL